MKKKIEIIIEFEDLLKNFQIGASYSKNDLVKYEYVSPRGFENIWESVKHNFKTDLTRLKTYCKSEYNYIYNGFREFYVNGKKLFIASFVAASSVILTAGTLAFNNEYLVGKPNHFEGLGKKLTVITKLTSKKAFKVNHKVIKPKPKADTLIASTDVLVGESTAKISTPKLNKLKTKAVVGKQEKHKPGDVVELLPRVPIRSVEKIKSIKVEVVFNPSNLIELYNGQKREELLSPKENNIKKFNSYDDGVLYFYKMLVQHNLTSDKPVNVIGVLSQIAIEAGLRKSSGGFMSTLSTYSNNPLGVKTWDKSEPQILAKDDDYKNGKLVHAGFIMFPNFKAAIEHYADFVYKKRYTHGDGILDLLDDDEYTEYAQKLKDRGYCSNGRYAAMVESVAENEIIPCLEKHKIL